jgi:hypothetical protein
MKAIIRKRQKRLSESNKPTAFRVRKRPVPQGKIDRYIIENSTIANYDGNIGGDTGSAGIVPASSKLTWINDLIHIYMRSYTWRHQLLHAIRYGTSDTTRRTKLTCGL